MKDERISKKNTKHKISFLSDTLQFIQAEIARKNFSLNEVMLWHKGTVVVLDKIVGSPIDLIIGENLIARGEVIVVNDHFGIRISEITHPEEKVKDH
tara:strand:+ start:771 stop:1061 length:291 start_codon:yes stop_codon:yes gene_type:complete